MELHLRCGWRPTAATCLRKGLPKCLAFASLQQVSSCTADSHSEEQHRLCLFHLSASMIMGARRKALRACSNNILWEANILTTHLTMLTKDHKHRGAENAVYNLSIKLTLTLTFSSETHCDPLTLFFSRLPRHAVKCYRRPTTLWSSSCTPRRCVASRTGCFLAISCKSCQGGTPRLAAIRASLQWRG